MTMPSKSAKGEKKMNNKSRRYNAKCAVVNAMREKIREATDPNTKDGWLAAMPWQERHDYANELRQQVKRVLRFLKHDPKSFNSVLY